MCTGAEIAIIAAVGGAVVGGAASAGLVKPKTPEVPKVASIDDARVQAAAQRERRRTGARQGRRSTLLSTEAGSGEAPKGLL